MKEMEFSSYEEAKKKFRWGDRWKMFDKDRNHLNIAYECVDRHPKNKTAIRLKNSDRSSEFYTFGELSKLTSQFANMLEKKGIKAGDRVAVVLNPSIEYYVSMFGILKRSAVAVPCYSLLGTEGIEYRFKDSDAKMAIISRERIDNVPSGLVSHLIASEDLLDMIEDENDHYETSSAADTLAVVQFTSGTTGQPSQVLYKHASVTATGVMIKLMNGLKDDDRYMCTSSPAWGHGVWYGTIGPLIHGNGIGAYSGRFDPEVFLEALEEFEITVMSAIPRVYKMLMDCDKIDNYNIKLRSITYTGGAMDKEVVKYFLDKIGVYIRSGYGNTETGPVALDYPFDNWKPRIGSAGKAMIGVKIGIIDDKGNELPPGKIGEVAIWRNNEWRMIGDSGYLDEDNYFWPKGRSDDVIKSSGYRIGPFEVETVIDKHPAVLKSAVVGSPHKERGEIVKAFVILQPEEKPTDDLVAQIQEFVKIKLSMHEYPKEIEFIDSFPETPDGKLKRKLLKKREYEKKGLTYVAPKK